jgi:hypothetical protein
MLQDYEGKWVVLSKDYKKVLAFGDSIAELGNTVSKGVMMMVPETEGTFIPTSL